MDRLRRLLGASGGAGGSAAQSPLYKKHTLDAEEFANELSKLVPKVEAVPAAGQHAASGGIVQLTVSCDAGTGAVAWDLVVVPAACAYLSVKGSSTGGLLVGSPTQQPLPCRCALPQLSVQGMHCSACSGAVESALRELPGVLAADVALLSETATVRYSAATTSEGEVLAAVEGCGFTARVVSSSAEDGGAGAAAAGGGGGGGAAAVKLRVEGMHCGACSSGGRPVGRLLLHGCAYAGGRWGSVLCVREQTAGCHAHVPSLLPTLIVLGRAAVETALKGVPGVEAAAVSLTIHQAEVRYRSSGGAADMEERLVAAVEACGFEASGGWAVASAAACSAASPPPQQRISSAGLASCCC